MTKTSLQPVHPGEVLEEEFLAPMGLSQNRLAIAIGVAPRRINEIVLQRRSVTADTALRLARYFGNSPEFGAICAFLCSQHAGYINGQNILADGGAYPGTF